MSLGLDMKYQICVSSKISSTFMFQQMCSSTWLLMLLLSDLCFIQSWSVKVSKTNTLHECTLPPIGHPLAPLVIWTTAHYFRFALYLCTAHKLDSPQWDLRILEQVHGCFWQRESQFSSNIIKFIKSCPSAVCIISVYLKCKFHLLQYFLLICV